MQIWKQREIWMIMQRGKMSLFCLVGWSLLCSQHGLDGNLRKRFQISLNCHSYLHSFSASLMLCYSRVYVRLSFYCLHCFFWKNSKRWSPKEYVEDGGKVWEGINFRATKSVPFSSFFFLLYIHTSFVGMLSWSMIFYIFIYLCICSLRFDFKMIIFPS